MPDVNTQDAPAAAPSATETAENLDSFDIDESDFHDDKADSKEESQDETEESDDSTDETKADHTDTEGDAVTDKTEKTDTKPKGLEGRKDQVNGEIRELVAQRNQIQKEVAQLNAKVYEARTADQIAEQDNISPEMAEIQAMREERELERYNNQVAEAQLTINTEASRLLQDFPIFDEKSDTFNKDIAGAFDELLAGNFIRDPNTEQTDANGQRIPGSGQIIGQNLSTYQLAKLVHDATQIGTTNGQLKGQKAVKKMMATADTVSSDGPKDSKKDAFLEGFDKGFN